MHVFERDTADAAWGAAADELLHCEGVARQASRCGPTRELLHVGLVIGDPRQRWIVSRRPVPNPAFGIAETIWILAGRNDSAFPNFWNPLLPRFSGRGPTYHGAYGHRLRHSFGLDQLERAYRVLSANPDSRQVVLGIYHPGLDLPDEGGTPVSEDVPCNVCSLLKLRGGRLEWVQVMRSNDLIRGLPYNVVQFTMIQEIMAGWLGVQPGSYTHFSDSLHVYESDLDGYAIVGGVPAEPHIDRLDLPYDESLRVLSELTGASEELRSPRLSRDRLRELATSGARPAGYQNLFAVLAADASRRHGWTDVAAELLGMCTNPVLHRACSLWFEKCRAAEPPATPDKDSSAAGQG